MKKVFWYSDESGQFTPTLLFHISKENKSKLMQLNAIVKQRIKE